MKPELTARPGASVNHVPYADGLRGLAVLLVVFHHAPMAILADQHFRDPLEFVRRIGYCGVELFFVLSGFCLAYPFVTKHPRTFDCAEFAARRLVRIVPPYYAAVGILALLYFGAGDHRAVDFPSGIAVVSGFDVAKQLLFVDRDTTFLSGPFWTLAVEFQWYFVFPIAIWLWVRSPRLFVVPVMAALVATRLGSPSGVVFALPAFLLGIVAADVRVRRAVKAPLALTALAVSLGLALAVEWHGSTGLWPLRYTMWECAAFAFVVAAGAVPAMQRTLTSPGLLFAGKISYSLYLTHMAVLVWAQAALTPIEPHVRTLLATALALAAGVAFWWGIERPFTEGRLRAPAVRNLRGALAALMNVARIPTAFPLPAGNRAQATARPETAGILAFGEHGAKA